MAEGQSTDGHSWPQRDSLHVEYRDIPGLTGYCVGNDGSIWSRWKTGVGGLGSEWHQLSLKPVRNGYHVFTAGKHAGVVHGHRKCCVHTAVLLAFFGPCPPGMECRHLNGNPGDNRESNLKWGTKAENGQDRIDHGTVPRGDGSSSAVLAESDIPEIDRMYTAGMSANEIAAHFGCASSSICYVLNRKTWKHVPLAEGAIGHTEMRRTGEANGRCALDETKVIEIRTLYASGRTTQSIAKDFGVSNGAVKHIVNRRNWSHIGGPSRA